MERRYTVDIHANQGLQAVGINIRAGQSVTLSYLDGQWSDASDAPLFGPQGDASREAGSDAYLPGHPIACLVGKVGDSVFSLGNGDTIPDNLEGQLLLGFNGSKQASADSIGAYVGVLQIQISSWWPTALVVVNANQQWQTAGVVLESHQHVRVKARRGRWMLSETEGFCNADGYPGLMDNASPVADVAVGCLIGKVGEQIFRIGSEGKLPKQLSGELFLMANDSTNGLVNGEVNDEVENSQAKNDYKTGRLTVELDSISTEIQVAANTPEQTTGIMIDERSDVYVRVVGGQWTSTAGAAPHSALGDGTPAGATAPLPGQPRGMLIARIGDQPPIAVANGVLISNTATSNTAIPNTATSNIATVTQAGELRLGMNIEEDQHAGLDGDIHVEVTGAVPVSGARPCLNTRETEMIKVTPPAVPVKIMAISAWIRPDRGEPSNQTVPVFSMSDEKGARVVLCIDPVSVHYSDKPADGEPTQPVARYSIDHILPDKEWTFIMFSTDGSTVSLHCHTGTQSHNITAPLEGGILECLINEITIAGMVDQYVTPFSGTVASVAVWDRPLSPEDFTQLTTKALKGDEVGLAQYWPLNEGRGLSVCDLVKAKPGKLMDLRAADVAPVWQETILPITTIIKKNVHARGGWQFTNIEIVHHASSAIKIVASGQVKGHPDAAIHSAAGDLQQAGSDLHPLATAPVGSLIGRIGSHVFAIGEEVDISPLWHGKLYLKLNTPEQTAHHNEGVINVDIEIPWDAQLILPHPARPAAYSGSRNSLLSQSRHMVAAQLADAHKQSNDSVQDAHAKAAKKLAAATAPWQDLVVVGNSGLSKFKMHAQGSSEKSELMARISTFDAGEQMLEFAPMMAVNTRKRLVYVVNQNAFGFDKDNVDIELYSFSGKKLETHSIRVRNTVLNWGSIVNALWCDEFTNTLYVLTSTWDQRQGQANFLQTLFAVNTVGFQSVNWLLDFRRDLFPGFYGGRANDFKSGTFYYDIKGATPNAEYADRVHAATRFWMSGNSAHKKLYINGRGKVWQVDLSSNEVTTVNLPGGWPIAFTADDVSERFYWLDFDNKELRLKEGANTTSTILSTDGTALALDSDNQRVFISTPEGVVIVDLTRNQSVPTTFAREQYVDMVFYDPAQAQQHFLAEVVEKRKEAARVKAKKIADAHASVAQDKQNELAKLQMTHEDANRKRAKAVNETTAKVTAQRTKLAQAHDSSKQQIQAAHNKAYSDRSTALSDKQWHIDRAHQDAAVKRSPAEAKLRNARAKRH
jgi:hypothetical protein